MIRDWNYHKSKKKKNQLVLTCREDSGCLAWYMQKYFFREHNDNTVPTQFRVLMCMLLFVSVRLNDNNSQYQSLDGERSRFKYPNINDLFLKQNIKICNK